MAVDSRLEFIEREMYVSFLSLQNKMTEYGGPRNGGANVVGVLQ